MSNAAFENPMSRTQTILGWIYLPIHRLLVPLLLQLYASVAPRPVSDVMIEFLWIGIGVAVMLCVMFSYLRRCFDRLLDRRRTCLLTLVIAPLAYYALATFVGLLLLLLSAELGENPNDNTIIDWAQNDPGLMTAVSIFLAPILEELLYRGVVFGSIRPRSRAWAYVVSLILFILPHVWPYALVAQDLRLLLYVVQYLPLALVLTWAYECSGSIWVPIFLHMANNALMYLQNGLL